jgi:hypothetical protein
MREMVSDVTVSGDVMSSCCYAAMYEFGDSYICLECKEWCDLILAE